MSAHSVVADAEDAGDVDIPLPRGNERGNRPLSWGQRVGIVDGDERDKRKSSFTRFTCHGNYASHFEGRCQVGLKDSS